MALVEDKDGTTIWIQENWLLIIIVCVVIVVLAITIAITVCIVSNRKLAR